MSPALVSRVDNVVVPVADVERARAWYRDVLDLSVGEVLAGHLCVVAMERGPGLLLDQKLTPDAPRAVARGAYPLCLFGTDDVEAALAALRERDVETVAYGGAIVQNGHWFNFRDCEGNLLMMCGPA